MNPDYLSTCGESEPKQFRCKVSVNEKGDICGETDGLEILDQVHELYANRVKELDDDKSVSETNRISMKLQVMTDWVKDLSEQNTMLVSTVQDLEQAAAQKVKLLDQKLQQSTNLMSEYMMEPNKSEKELKDLTKKVHELEQEEKYLHKKVGYLQSDIRGLMELIRRTHQNNWNLEDIQFFEILPKDIPAPPDCHCSQEKGDINHLQCTYSQVKTHENDKIVEYQHELQNKLLNANKTIEEQKKIVNYFVEKFRNLKKHFKVSDETELDLSETKFYFDIGSATKIVDHAFVAIDIEVQNLHQQLEETESKLTKLMHENDHNRNHMHTQLEEKCKQIRELEVRLANVEKESTETTKILSTEVAEKHDEIRSMREEIRVFEDKCRCFTAQVLYRDNVIKELKKENKHSNLKGSSSTRKVCINVDIEHEQEDKETSHNLSDRFQNEILTSLCNIKTDMEKQMNIIFELKEEFENAVEHLYHKGNQFQETDIKVIYNKLHDMEMLLQKYKIRVIEASAYSENVKRFFTITEEKIVHLQNLLRINPNIFTLQEKDETVTILSSIIENVTKLYLEKEKTITYLKHVTKLGNLLSESNANVKNEKETLSKEVHNAMKQQFQLMEEFRMCTIEAQAATEDLHEEAESVILNFNDRHQKYIDLSIVVYQVRDYLIKSRQNVYQAIHRLELQEEERKRHSERIIQDSNKLKDIKNDINRTRADLSLSLNNIQKNMQTCSLERFSETHIYNDLLNTVVDEVDHIVSNLSVFQSQDCCVMKILTNLKDELSTVECTLQNLQHKSDEVCEYNKAAQKVFCQRQKKLEKLEEELDCTHTKMQNTLENILDKREKMSQFGFVNKNEVPGEEIKEYLKMKTDFQKLKKDYEDLKIKLVEEESKSKQSESIRELKNQFIDMQDEVAYLKNEVQGKQEANNILKVNIDSIEKELCFERTKAETHRKFCSTENVELKMKIFELEKAIQIHKDIENDLRNNLACNEIELKKSKDLLNTLHTDFTLDENHFKHGLQQTKHDISEGSHTSCSTMMSAINVLGQCDNNTEHCSRETNELKSALVSKDKLLKNMDEIIKIQNNSIAMMQTEMKDVHKKHQEQIDLHDTIVAQHKEEKNKLLKQIELQTQTIGHLQDAVVEAKKCIDQMGHKAVSDVSEMWSSVSPSVFNHSNVHDV